MIKESTISFSYEGWNMVKCLFNIRAVSAVPVELKCETRNNFYQLKRNTYWTDRFRPILFIYSILSSIHLLELINIFVVRLICV
jgi:hypothetical protein